MCADAQCDGPPAEYRCHPVPMPKFCWHTLHNAVHCRHFATTVHQPATSSMDIVVPVAWPPDSNDQSLSSMSIHTPTCWALSFFWRTLTSELLSPPILPCQSSQSNIDSMIPSSLFSRILSSVVFNNPVDCTRCCDLRGEDNTEYALQSICRIYYNNVGANIEK